jgi:hypothetical protein
MDLDSTSDADRHGRRRLVTVVNGAMMLNGAPMGLSGSVIKGGQR